MRNWRSSVYRYPRCIIGVNNTAHAFFIHVHRRERRTGALHQLYIVTQAYYIQIRERKRIRFDSSYTTTNDDGILPNIHIDALLFSTRRDQKIITRIGNVNMWIRKDVHTLLAHEGIEKEIDIQFCQRYRRDLDSCPPRNRYNSILFDK